jgi:threonine dehydratase
MRRMPLERQVAVPDASHLSLALAAVRRHLPETPVVPAATLGDDVWLKLETLQPVGAFKVRGALAALSRRGGRRVVTASAGNHALAVAWAARRLGVDAQVMVPETASPAKLAALRAAGADLVVHGVDVDAAEALALSVAADGAEFVSAYNDTDVIAGNATIGAELDAVFGSDELCVVVPIGGGGLLAGIAVWARGRPNVRVVGVEAEASRQMSAAFAAGGRRVVVDVHPTVADGLAGNLEVGAITPGIALAAVEEIVAVSEPELRDAMRELALSCGVVAEGAGAAATAAILAGRIRRRPGETVVALVTGRNCTSDLLREVLDARGGIAVVGRAHSSGRSL